jgi:hypothetical protein
MFIRYPKIKILGDRSNKGILTTPGQIIITEKVDGGNFGFYIKDDILYFCSHNANLTDSEQITKTGIPKRWRGIEPVLESWKNDPTLFDLDLYYFGESMQKHTISYDNISGFIGFDIISINTELFLNWKLAKQEFEKLNLPFINIYNEINVNDVTLDYLKSLYQKSAYKEGSAEGIVIKRYDLQLMAKIVDDKFKEKNRKIFGRTEQPKMTDDIRITEVYATPARIEKMIYKLHDTGYNIEISMMQILFKEVVKDILEEEILNIYSEYKSINFKILNNLVSKKCITILKNVIMDKERFK